MKDTRFAYVAGLIDADGSLYISKSVDKYGYAHYDPIVMIRSTHLPTVKWLIKIFGGTYDRSVWKKGCWKDYYRWKFSSDKHASRFLDKILPYLWLKRKSALVLREYYRLSGIQCKVRRDILYHRAVEANHSLSVTPNTSSLSLKRNLRQAYLAGMFDGEGSSYILRVKQRRCTGFYYRACVSLGSTCREIVQELQKVYGGFVRKRPPHNGVLWMYEWDVKDNYGKENFLLSILPYLRTKTEQSKIVLNFVRLNGQPLPEKRKSMWLTCSKLNGKKIETELHGDV